MVNWADWIQENATRAAATGDAEIAQVLGNLARLLRSGDPLAITHLKAFLGALADQVEDVGQRK